MCLTAIIQSGMGAHERDWRGTLKVGASLRCGRMVAEQDEMQSSSCHPNHRRHRRMLLVVHYWVFDAVGYCAPRKSAFSSFLERVKVDVGSL